MSLDFRFGRADTQAEFDLIAQVAAANPEGYEPDSHRDWAYGKLFDYMTNGNAIPCPVLHENVLASVVVGYTRPAQSPEDMPSIEAKLVRTLPPYLGRGLAALGVRTLLVNAAVEMNLPPGSAVRMHLDTRNSDVVRAFTAMGFVEIDETRLYVPNPTNPQQPDVLMERTFTVPEYL